MAESKNIPKKNLLFISLPWSDPALNLTLEEYLLEHPEAVPGNLPVLLVYENSESLVIGKNQNPWKEIPFRILARGTPPLYRRISGGGAVYHGPGNLNYSFIMSRESFVKEDNLDFVRRAAAGTGAVLHRTERGDLIAGSPPGGRKVSGNAMCFRRGRVLHHGTLLVNADLAALRASLDPGGRFLSVDTRAVASVSMRVTNLADLVPGLDVPTLIRALRREAGNSYAGVTECGDPRDLVPAGALERLRRRYGTREWTLGMTPAFSCRIGALVLTVENGRVSDVRTTDVRTADALQGDPRGGGSPASVFIGKFFDIDVIDSLHEIYEEEKHGLAEHVKQA